MDNIWAKIRQIAEANSGCIKTGQVEAAGISRPMLKKYRDKGYLRFVRKGLYVLEGELIDEYMLLQLQSSTAVFAYGTALYLWNLSDRTPHFLDITLPWGTNATRLKRDNENVRFHYSKKEFYRIGITQTASPYGNLIRLYDRERCICDLIRAKEKVEMQIYTQGIKDYFNANPDFRKLLKYGKQFGIEEKIRTYLEVLR